MISYNQQSGLFNLGNTCYMNSAIQVLANTPGFIDYILNDIYQFDINLTNPLGSQGTIISSFANLLKEIKKGQQKSFVPKEFKQVFSKFYNNYYGNNQQDASEFLLQLLDAINEDVNLIKNKPYIPTPNTKGRDDLVVAIESWDAHTQRNQSIITQLFQAQFKSKIECPHCKNQSVSFDPYMIIQLPLVSKQNDKGIIFYLLDEKQKQTQMNLPLFKNYDIDWLQNQIRDQLRNQNLIFDLSNKQNVIEMRLEDDMQLLKQNLKTFKFLVRQMSQFELQIPYNLRCNTLITHINAEYQCLTEIVTFIFDSRTKVYEIYEFVEKNYAQQFHCQFELYLLSNSMETEQVCYFCHKQYCRYCRFVKSQHSLKYYCNLISSPSFKFNLVIKWFEQGIPIIFNQDTYQENVNQTQNNQIKQDKQSQTIYDCLNNFQQQQQLDENNSWYCKQCKDHVKAIKQLLIFSAPQILIFHLKRFKSSDNLYQKIKNNALIKFPLCLNMTKFISNQKLPNQYLDEIQVKEVKYQLFGVINHFGEINEGHYNCFVKNYENQRWFCCDDSVVSEIQKEDIMTNNAYVLFYERLN